MAGAGRLCDTSPMTRRSRRLGSIIGVTGLVLALGGIPSPTTPVAAQSACAEPFAPVAFAREFSGSQERLPPVSGEDRFARPQGPPPPDTDGDGTPDEIVPRGVVTDPSVLIRGDGTLTFERPGANVSAPENVGDLDGDGRDDVAVSIEPDASTATEGYIVPGATPVGSHDPADVGVRVTPWLHSIPDRDGDGIPDLVDAPEDGPIRIWSGAALVAPGAGGDARAVPPFLELPGTLLGFADLDGAMPVILTGEVGGTPEQGIIRLFDETGSKAFTTAPHTFYRADTSPFGAIRIQVSGEGTFLTLSSSSRSGGASYLWRVDDPCGAPTGAPEADPPPAATPEAPGAAPIAASPNYTG